MEILIKLIRGLLVFGVLAFVWFIVSIKYFLNNFISDKKIENIDGLVSKKEGAYIN